MTRRCVWQAGCGLRLVPQHSEVPEGWAAHGGRGLCTAHYGVAFRNGELFDYERSVHTWDETLDEWDILRRQGMTRGEAAEQMGMRVDALDRAIFRGEKARDPRAVWAPKSRHHLAVAGFEKAQRERRERARQAGRRAA